MIVRYIALYLLLLSLSVSAKLPFNIFDVTLSGYIKGEAYTDTRRTTSNEKDEISFFPLPQVDDPAGHDRNAHSSTRMDAFESRVCADLSGLKMRDAEISGQVEVDFEIFAVDLINMPHLRHAYGKLDWNNFTFLFGQTWHPFVFIETKNINYNGSTPFDFYSRNPQFRCIYHSSKNINLIFTVASQTADFVSDGPEGYSTNYMRDGVIPNFNIKCEWLLKDIIMGISGDYKRLAPRIESDNGFKVHERINSFAALWYLGLKWPWVELDIKANWGQNATDYAGIGGYAIKNGSVNPVTHKQEYTNLSNIALWLDVEIVKNQKIKPGIFIGFAQNLGATHDIKLNVMDAEGEIIQRNIFGFVTDVNNVFRISPRVTCNIGNLTFAGEVEYTSAAYGTIQHNGRVTNTRPAELIRCTFGAYYYF